MVLGLCLFVLLINEAFCIQQFLIYVSQMLFQDLLSLEIPLELFVDFFNNSSFFLNQLIQLFVLIVGKLRNIILALWILCDLIIFLLLTIVIVITRTLILILVLLLVIVA